MMTFEELRPETAPALEVWAGLHRAGITGSLEKVGDDCSGGLQRVIRL